ncbi:MAG: VOC family protein [Actinocrinis sp.]
MQLDHVSYACGTDAFPSTVSRLGALLGAPFRDGGVHPRYGTRNAVLPLDGGSYVEVVTPLDHPATDSAPFGQAVRRRAALGGGWLGWVVSVEDLAPFEKRLGRPSAEGHRRRPDGVLLQWRQLGVLDLIEDPQIPYLIEWCCPHTDHPSAGADGAVGIDRLEISGQRGQILDWLGTPEADPLPHVHVNWLEPADVANAYGEAGLVAVDFHTAHGSIRID